MCKICRTEPQEAGDRLVLDTRDDRAMYCRKCGYALIGLRDQRCPECGRGFDPADRRTFFIHSAQWRQRRWIRRAAILAGCVSVLMVVNLLCLYVPWNREQKIAALIQRNGGSVQLSAGRSIWTQGLVGPYTLRLRIDRIALSGRRWAFTDSDLATILDGTSELDSLAISDVNLSAASLRRIQRLPRLRELYLFNAGLSDADLALLKGMKPLENLNLGSIQPNAAVSDAGIAHIATLTSLRELHLQATGIGDAGLAHLTALTGLEHLDLLTCRGVTSAGMPHIAGLPRLRVLDLRGTEVDDAGLGHLAGLRRLESLGVGRRTSDAGLQHVSSLTGLTWLDLSGTSVTDAGLQLLTGLKSLRLLYLNDTDVSPEAVQRLKAALPQLQVNGPGPLTLPTSQPLPTGI